MPRQEMSQSHFQQSRFKLKREGNTKGLPTMATTTDTPAKKNINHVLNISNVNSNGKFCNKKKRINLIHNIQELNEKRNRMDSSTMAATTVAPQ